MGLGLKWLLEISIMEALAYIASLVDRCCIGTCLEFQMVERQGYCNALLRGCAIMGPQNLLAIIQFMKIAVPHT